MHVGVNFDLKRAIITAFAEGLRDDLELIVYPPCGGEWIVEVFRKRADFTAIPVGLVHSFIYNSNPGPEQTTRDIVGADGWAKMYLFE